ncbi:MAG TPA: type II toxin-antitoxin system RelE/ParE family toxin [Caulobacteraceae bacterium]|jgi:toxin ParE1/3/4
MTDQRIVLSLDAEADLTELFDWIATDSGIARAESILRRIEDVLDLIADTPLIGRVRTDLDGAPRSFAVWPWIVIYEPLADASGIVVWRVIDGRRDLPRHERPPRR